MITQQRIQKIGVLIGLMISLSANLQAQDPKLPQVSREVLSAIIKAIPAPLEIAFLLKDQGVPYNAQLFSATNNASKYTTSYQQAINLGIYSTNLGFTMMYENKKDALAYLKSIKQLAQKLKVDFDLKKIEYFLNKGNAQDSFLIETNTRVELINDDLYTRKGRPDLSILIITGGWLEALYTVVKANDKSPNSFFISRIGEQKIILEQILLLLSFYEENPAIGRYVTELTKIQKAFNQIKANLDLNTPTFVENNNGILILQNNTPAKVKLVTKKLKGILNITTQIRNKIIQGK